MNKINQLKHIGFKKLNNYTVLNSLSYNLGRGRYLMVVGIGTPNEIIMIGQNDEHNNKNIKDLVVLRNYDYDGYTELEDIMKIITVITGHVFNNKNIK